MSNPPDIVLNVNLDQTIPLLRQIGRYQILRELGRGTMGIVYEGFDPKLERTVALKTVRLEAGDKEHREFEERFQREGKSAARLNHPNIVTIHDAGEDDGVAYIAMEFLEGKSLRELLDSGAHLSLDDRISYGIQMADVLDYAHRFDIVHRDIKPGNIVISSQGRVKISDFGIAQLPSGNLTQAGTILGTPKYMSPEQVRSERLDGRSDIFSLGVILYELFAGQAPFTGDSLAAIMYQILHGQPADPASFNPECPPGIRQIVARCLAKEKHARYPQAGDIAADLRRYRDIVPNPQLMAIAYGSPDKVKTPESPSAADQTQPLQPLPATAPLPAMPARMPGKWPWLAGIGLPVILLAGVGYWNSAPSAGAKPNASSSSVTTTTLRQQVSDDPGETRPRPTNSAESKKKASPKTETTAPAKTKKGFWRRQVDCFKHGICDKTTPPPEPPPGFSP